MAPREGVKTEAICGSTDDRVASANPRAGRIMPVGCTGWLIDGGSLLSAGHCIGTDFQTVEFNVPASLANGTTVAPPVRDQYRVVAGSIVSQNGGVGNDWAVFQVLPEYTDRSHARRCPRRHLPIVKYGQPGASPGHRSRRRRAGPELR